MKHWVSNNLYALILIVLLVLVVISVSFTTRLANQFAQEEQRRIELWAEATRQLITMNTDEDINPIILSVIENNTTIPVYIVDSNHQLLLSRNVEIPQNDSVEFFRNKINKLQQSQDPIVIKINDDVQYIYYEDSTLLRQLYWFPYIQIAVIVAFLIIAVIALILAQRSERNNLWVGLSKETAHQLGTPISSLNAWSELLKVSYPEDHLIPQMDEDIRRLQMITERFSKIGSKPELELVSLDDVLDGALAYMDRRTSSRVTISDEYKVQRPVKLMLNIPLFEWVIENLCKNAIDAMEGKGAINVVVSDCGDKICIDVSDTGKGIPRSKFGTVFNPGYTTKKRGWGVGLSLVKRIVESYHEGKIFVKRSEINKGTTFRILLPKRMNSKASETRNL